MKKTHPTHFYLSAKRIKTDNLIGISRKGILKCRKILVLLLLFIANVSNAEYSHDSNIDDNKNKAKVERAVMMSMIMTNSTSCYSVDDATNHLIEYDFITDVQVDYGASNATSLEAIITSINGDIVYGANASTFGSIDLSDGSYTIIGSFGSGNGDQGVITLDDVDGLAIDVTTGIYYGSHREGDGGAPEDVLFKFNPLTGAVIQNGFGNDEYVSIEAITVNGNTYNDIDDISVDPITGQMYGIANQGGGSAFLVEINKATGATTLVAEIDNAAGNFTGDVEGLSVYNDGTFYISTGDTPGKLYTINVANAIVTEVGTFSIGGDYEGLACLTRGYITAVNDESFGNTSGTDVTLNLLSNDFKNVNNQIITAGEVSIDINPSIPGNQSTLVVSGEGTWTVSNGNITFSPESGFVGDPTPIDYTITLNSNGATSTAKVTIDYVNCYNPDGSSNVIFGNVYSDNNVNQIKNTGEPGYENIEVQLFEDMDNNGVADGPAIMSTTTNSIGDYEFTLKDLVFEQNGTYNQTVSIGCNDGEDGDNNNNNVDLGKNKDFGIRFTGITIPSGAIISSAYIYLTSDENKNEAGSSVNIYGHDVANPVNFCSNSDVTGRTKTSNVTPWSMPNNWVQNQEYQSANISNVISELVSSYTYDNDEIALILISTGSKGKKAFTVEGSSSNAPRLTINYTVPGEDHIYIVSTNATSYPQGAQLTTDNIEVVSFTAKNTMDCDNHFGLNEPPVAVNNEDLDNLAYSIVSNIDLVSNDTDPNNNLQANTVNLDPTSVSGGIGTDTDNDGDIDQVVGDDGTWQVDENGFLTFTPDQNLFGDPEIINYNINDLADLTSNDATVRITYVFHNPVATNDSNDTPSSPENNTTLDIIDNDFDVDNDIDISTIDFDPTSVSGNGFDRDNDGDIDSVYVSGEGSWVVSELGIVIFTPEPGFTEDPKPIDYTITDKTGLESGTATVTLDYVPLAVNDTSTGNTTNTNVTLDIIANDTEGDVVDPTTVSLTLTGLPVDATCSATDAAGDCIEVTIPGQGVYSINETTGAITFDPQPGFTANPDPITYNVRDEQDNETSALVTIEYIAQPPVATDNEDLANLPGNVTQQVVTEDDGDGVDSDPDGALTLASLDLDPATSGIQSTLVVANEGTWSADAAGNVTFTPDAGFTLDPTPITYTINDNDANTSNIANIIVDYVPVANDDSSTGNTTNTNVTLDIVNNDTDGDTADPTTVSLTLTGLPVDATCSATDAAGDCIEVTIPGQGVYSINETTGAITFDPQPGFTANPDPITYNVRDEQDNETSALVTIEYIAQPPVATDNEDLANLPGNVTQQVVTEDDGDGVDSDPDGALTLASLDLDPATSGVQATLVVANEGTWSADAAGNVTFTPDAGFTLDPTPITYTINDNDANTSNIANIIVDYVPVANDDSSTGNTTNTNVTLDIVNNDVDGDTADPTTVSLTLTGLPVDATCSATDAAGDCIEVTIPGQGVYSINETTGAITFDPQPGFTANPDPITYNVRDEQDNETSALVTIEYDAQPPVATDNEDLANLPGNVTQQVVTEDDGDGVDSDPDGALTLASLDLDPATSGVQATLVVANEGTWSADAAGNVTFTPDAGFTLDPTPITYTINDNDANTSNIANIIVDYVPVANDDSSTGNTTNTNVTLDIVNNDVDGDTADPTTVSLTLTGLPVDATCSANDAAGDCIEVTIPGQGVYSINETTGAITFDPQPGFTANPDPITYNVRDEQDNETSALVTIEYIAQPPVATDNEDLANLPGNVTQQVVTEDDGDGVDSDPDGALTLASLDLDPATSGVQATLVVANEGTWSADAAGNVTFTPDAGFTLDPTPITYTINDNDANTSNIANIIVDYVPVANDDTSTGNTTNTNVTLDIVNNDVDGDTADPTTVSLTLTGLPVDATCSANDAAGDCIEVTIPGQGVYSINETTGAITFDPQPGFTANPDPITYNVRDEQDNETSALVTIEYDAQPPVATDNEDLANLPGNVTQQVVTEDDGDGVDSDPDGALTLASLDLDPATSGIQSTLVVANEGTWSADAAGNVTFTPDAGFTLDPTPITYTINDNDANTSNIANIIVDYVPVANDDSSTGNTTNTNVTLDIVNNDTDGDTADPTTVSLTLTGLPVDATCSATDAAGDCIEVTIPGQGVYSINETTGAITFDPQPGFTANPDPITYNVRDEQDNETSALVTIEYIAQPPVATDNEDLANLPGNVTQQVVTEDDGDGVDSDPDGALTLASLDLDPTTSGVQATLVVANEGTWSADAAGNVTFTPDAGFTLDPTPITYTINDNDANTSNIANIIVDYVPVANDDSSTGNTTNTNVTLDIIANDVDGDTADPATVSLTLTGLPVDATCSATDAAGDCIEVTIPGQGVYSINETTGAITFDPQPGFTANPDPITYNVRDEQDNETSALVTIEYIAQPPVATDNEDLANLPGNVTQQVVTEDDGDGVDSDPDGALTLASLDLDPATSGVQATLVVANEGTWSADAAGNVTFTPDAGFTLDPTPITYTINDNDANTSNIANIIVDYVPVANDDSSTGNTTNTNVTLDIIANDVDGDTADPATVSLTLTGLPVDATCSANDAAGDCIEVTIPGQGVYSINETTGAITFDPETGFTANPDPITYTVEDEEGNQTSALVTITYDSCLELNLRVYLEASLLNNGGETGPKGPLMRDDLRSSPYDDVLGTNYIPETEPYTGLPAFTHFGDGGGEMATDSAFNFNGDNSVVDWVFIELRNKVDSTEVLFTRSALLQRDGDVVDVDGVSPLLFCTLPDTSYYIAIRHRNHLGVMSALPETLTPEGTEVDFTNGNSNLSGEYNFGTEHPEGSISGYDYTGLSQKSYLGVRALWLGNSSHNDKVKYESPGDDKSQILFDVLFYPSNNSFQGAYDFGYGYYNGDVNMDSKAKYEAPGDDQSILLFQILFYPLNNTFQSAFDFMYEQIPNN